MKLSTINVKYKFIHCFNYNLNFEYSTNLKPNNDKADIIIAANRFTRNKNFIQQFELV